MEEKELLLKIENLEKRVSLLEKQLETISQINQSEKVKEYIASAEKASKIAKLLDVATDKKINDSPIENATISDVLSNSSIMKKIDTAKEFVVGIDSNVEMQIRENNDEANKYDWDTLFDYEEVDGQIKIKSYIGFDDLDMVVIPDAINGYPVTSIGKSAFEKCKGIKEVVLPKSVDFIGRRAFASSGLTKINLLNVRKIEYEAFAITRLNEITIPKYITCIAARTFYGCLYLEKIFFSEGLLEIGNDAFNLCGKCGEKKRLKVDIPNRLKKILPGAFFGVHNLKIRIPDSVELIGGERVFNNDARIYCNSGSYALKYARANGIEIHKYEEFDLLEE